MFTDDDLHALACFLARRVTPDLRAVPPATGAARPVELEAVVAWEHALADARARGGVAALVRQAAAVRPDDQALQEAANLVWPDRRGEGTRTAAVMVAVAALVALVVSVATLSTAGALLVVGIAIPDREVVVVSEDPALPAPVDPRPPGIEVAAAGPVAPDSPLDRSGLGSPAPIRAGGVGAPALREGDGPLGEPLPDAVTEPVQAAALVPIATPMSTRTVSDAPKAGNGGDSGPCQVDGWFYAGRREPGSDVYVVPHPIYVRAEPPRKENRWNASTRVRCYLAKGDAVRLTEPAIGFPGGHYWIHVVPGSVTRPGDVAVRED